MSEPSAPPADRVVDVWYSDDEQLVEPERVARCLAVLSPDEQQRYARFRFERHRRQFLAAHALVRTTLSRYAPLPAGAWQFETNAYGRPEIAQPDPCTQGLRFNLSHTEGLVVCAVAWHLELGVDVEHLDRRHVSDGLPERFFSPAEVRDLRAQPVAAQPRCFFDYWTLKEAYIKARGMGLAIPLDQFGYCLRAGEPIRIAFAPQLNDDPAAWQFAQHEPSPRHLISLALRRGAGPDWAVRFAEAQPDPD